MDENKTKPQTDSEHGEVETGTSSSRVIEQLQDQRKRLNPSTVPIDPRDPKQSP